MLAEHKAKIAKISAASAVLIASILLVSAGLASVAPAAVTDVSSADDGNGGTHPVSAVEIQIVLPPDVDPNNPVVAANELITFLAVATGGAGTLAYTWDFGDGTIIHNGCMMDHAYTSGGTYVILLTVVDSDLDGTVLGTASDSLTLTILGLDPDPDPEPDPDPVPDPDPEPRPEQTAQDLVNDLIGLVTSSCAGDWQNPRQKTTMLHKLDVLSNLITRENYAGAYRKLLNDILPKLAGRNTNRGEERHRERAWVVNPELRSSSLDIVNPLLDLLQDLAADPIAQSMIADLLATVASSDNSDWKRPRFKDNMLDQLNSVSTLIDTLKFNRAYLNLLDLKAKLTGRCAWIVDPDLKGVVLCQINALLAQLSPFHPCMPFHPCRH